MEIKNEDVCVFILLKACEQANIIYLEDIKYQQGFNAGCRFMANLVEEFKDRERINGKN